jgi:hypothetical protein
MAQTNDDLDKLIMATDKMLASASNMLIQLKVPEDNETDRKKIWHEARMKAEFSVLELGEVFASLKEAACNRKKEQTWFSFIRWVFWGY